jgi:Tfp pilus assembly protein PilV
MNFFHKNGFTLLETLFALVIIITGFFSVFSLMKTSISVTQSSINQLIASGLAQESIEILRNIRDNVYDDGEEWNVVIDNGHLNKYSCLSSSSTKCRLEYNEEKLLSESDEFLKIDNNIYYQYNSGEDSIFKRWINLIHGGGLCNQITTSTDCIQIKTTVSWKEKGQDKTLEVEDYLYSWY